MVPIKVSINKFLFQVAVGSLPLLNVLALNEKITFTIVVFSVLFFLRIQRLKFAAYDVFYLIFIASLSLSAIFNGYINKSSLLYITTFLTVYFIYFKNTVSWYQSYKKEFYSTLHGIVLFTSGFILYEFIALNFFPGVFIELPRATAIEYDSTFLRMYRPRGFAEEPGHMSLFFEFAIPLLVPYLNCMTRRKRIFSIFLIALAILLMGSSFTILLAIISITFFYSIKIIQKPKFFFTATVFLAICFFTVLTNPKIGGLVKDYSSSIQSKVSLDSNNSSVSDRAYRFTKGLELVSDNFLGGIGPMAFKEYSRSASSLNLSIDIWLYSGFVGILAFYCFLGLVLLIFVNSKAQNKKWILLSFFLIILHYQIITNFWFPYLWIVLGVMIMEKNLARFKEA